MSEILPWVIALIWMAIALLSMMQERANRKQADKWWHELQESHAQTQDVLDRWNKTISNYNEFIEKVSSK
jgi:ABC-type transporter lipoprotein component MlaA